MILLIDIGNSRIKIGLCKNPNIRNDINVFYCENINKINSELEKFDHYEFDAVLVSSVVPEINNKVTQIIKDNLNITPTFINGDLITGIKFNYSPLSDIGSDRIADCVAANNNYDKDKFKIVVDFGTATVFEVISNNSEFLGGSIFPGLEVASKALASRASLLNEINFDNWSNDQKVIGNTTEEALKSSIYWGYISLTEGIIRRIAKELKLNKNEYIIIGTGGFAEIINNQIPIFDKIDQNLTLDGMRIIYNLNKKWWMYLKIKKLLYVYVEAYLPTNQLI